MTELMIDIHSIKLKTPCEEGFAVLKASKPNLDDDDKFPLSDILESNGLEDTLWVLRCFPQVKYEMLWRKFAWWCAKRELEKYPECKHDIFPKCMDQVLRYIEGKIYVEDLSAINAEVLVVQNDIKSLNTDQRDDAQNLLCDLAGILSVISRSSHDYMLADYASDASRYLHSFMDDIEATEIEHIAKLKQIFTAGEWVD